MIRYEWMDARHVSVESVSGGDFVGEDTVPRGMFALVLSADEATVIAGTKEQLEAFAHRLSNKVANLGPTMTFVEKSVPDLLPGDSWMFPGDDEWHLCLEAPQVDPDHDDLYRWDDYEEHFAATVLVKQVEVPNG